MGLCVACLCMCLLDQSWPVGHCGSLRVRAVGFCLFWCVSRGGGGVILTAPRGRRRIGQTRIAGNTDQVTVCCKHQDGILYYYYYYFEIMTESNVTLIEVFSLTSENISMDQQCFHPRASLAVPIDPNDSKLLIHSSGIRSL